MEHYRALKVWQRAMEMVCAAYSVATLLPARERFGLASQIQRSAVSVAANIAEGHERRFPREYLRFLAMASGSLAELETLLDFCCRVGLLQPADVDQTRALADEVGRMIRAIEGTMRGRIEEDPGWPGAALVQALALGPFPIHRGADHGAERRVPLLPRQQGRLRQS